MHMPDTGNTLFGKPEDFDEVNIPERDPPPAGTFELGLVLGGTVSAGAYTAGFMDFLIQALDEFHDGGLEGGGPEHKVSLRAISGTSGGGMVAAQLGRSLFREFPPMPFDGDAATGRRNNLYKSWVEDIDIFSLLDRSDLDGSPELSELHSLLNVDRVNDIALGTLSFASGEKSLRRAWVGETLDVIMTHFNMRGVPFRVPYAEIDGEPRYQNFMAHADHLRFQIAMPGEGGKPRADSFAIDATRSSYPTLYAASAVGTGAFPGALAARTLSRPIGHYRYRGQALTIADKDNPGQFKTGFEQLRLDEKALADAGFLMPGQTYDYAVVDGGVANNEPLELCRTTLSGVLGRNPRGAKEANRGVIMVAPLFAAKSLPPNRLNSPATSRVMEVIGALIPSMRQALMFSTADMQLAGDENVHSRFMALPSRTDIHGNFHLGDSALTCSGLGAFLGFMDKRYRLHDYRLGRRNAWSFLRDEFWLDAANPLFDGWSDAQKEKHGEDYKGSKFLPVVPLVGSAKADPGVPAWPRGGLTDRPRIEKAFRRRISDLVDALPLEGERGDSVLSTVTWAVKAAALEPVEEFIEGYIMDLLVEAIDEVLEEKKLD